MNGKIFALYKPVGPTSNDALREVRKAAGTRHVGHAGTLDPLASGVLVVGIGREATKKLKDIVGQEKEYLAEIRLGAASTTDDAEGEKREISLAPPPSLGEVQSAIPAFIGDIRQVPPVYSAVKIRGKEAYKRARRGEVVEMQAREVAIKKIEILGYAWPTLKLRVVTGPGVYIRALARDIGHALGSGGYLAALERTRVGSFAKAEAIPLSALNDFFKNSV